MILDNWHCSIMNDLRTWLFNNCSFLEARVGSKTSIVSSFFADVNLKWPLASDKNTLKLS